MVMRMIDYLKGKSITALFTHLIPGTGASQEIEVGVSSLIDTWILLRNSPPGEQGGAPARSRRDPINQGARPQGAGPTPAKGEVPASLVRHRHDGAIDARDSERPPHL
jgi:hypothetical protein